MRYLSRQIVFREIPTEISLSYLITGCSMRCPGCHSADSWNPSKGEALDAARLSFDIDRYAKGITCVLFMGGEWHPHELEQHLILARSRGLKTALFTGREEVGATLLGHLDYLKTGAYVAHLGGLESPITNQRLIYLPTNQIINIRAYNQEDSHDSTQPSTDSGQDRLHSPIYVGSECGR